MAVKYQYLVDPLLGFQTKSGSLNVAGILRVFDAATDDPAVTYCDFSGTENSQDIRLDDNGRAVVIADDSRAYRIDVCDRYGALLYNQTPVYARGGGGGVLSNITVTSHDGTVDVTTTSEGGVKNFDLSVKHDDPEFIVTDSCAVTGTQNHSGYIVPQNRVDGGMDITSEGILLLAGNHYHVDAWINVNADQDNSDPSNEYRNREMLLNFRLGSENGTPVSMVFDNSYSHTSTYNLSGDIHPAADTYLKIYFDNYEWSDYQTGSMSQSHFDLPKLSVHSIVGHYYGEGGGSGEYIAGDGIDITESTISVDFDDVQHKLTAGTGITIQNNVISSTGGGSGLPSYNIHDAGRSLVVNSSGNSIAWEPRLPGHVFIIPEGVYSDDVIPDWDWLTFRAKVDECVANGTPMMVIRKSSGNHPAGETAYYYHAFMDTSLALDWIYVFGTVIANYMFDPAPISPSRHVTYKFYQYNDSSVKVRIEETELTPFPYIDRETDYDGKVLAINASQQALEWTRIHDSEPIDMPYTSSGLSVDISTVWNSVVSAIQNTGKNPQLLLRVGTAANLSDRYVFDLKYRAIAHSSGYYGKVQFSCPYLHVENGLTAVVNLYGILERASSSSTPTITWYEAFGNTISVWNPANGI